MRRTQLFLRPRGAAHVVPRMLGRRLKPLDRVYMWRQPIGGEHFRNDRRVGRVGVRVHHSYRFPPPNIITVLIAPLVADIVHVAMVLRNDRWVNRRVMPVRLLAVSIVSFI